MVATSPGGSAASQQSSADKPPRLFVVLESSRETSHELDTWVETDGPEWENVDVDRRDTYTWADGQTKRGQRDLPQRYFG
jgi:hypothetical protein